MVLILLLKTSKRRVHCVKLFSMCCSLSKSIGRVKITIQDDTTVEDVLKIAVNTGGESSFIYNSFAFVIKSIFSG